MFVVISYLKSGYNSAMSCVTESWHSDLILREFETREAAAEFIAEEEARQIRIRKYGEPLNREYIVIEGRSLTDCEPAKRVLDVLLEGSTI